MALVVLLEHTFERVSLLRDLQHLQETLRQSGVWGYGIFIGLFIISTLCLMPGSLLVIAGGVVFGAFWGSLLSLIAATFASALSFLIARWLGRELLLKYIGHTSVFQAIENGIARSGTDFLILTRLIPLFPYNIQNYAYGLTALPFWSFTLISAITTLPGIVIYSVMANELATQGINGAFIIKLSLAGVLLWALIHIAKRYGRYKKIVLPDRTVSVQGEHNNAND
ncbi:TVP38/TMEM64 family protein [Pseudocitrobacter sp. 73]